MQSLKRQKSGTTGIIITAIGGAMLGVLFIVPHELYKVYFSIAQSNFVWNSASNFVPSLSYLLQAAVGGYVHCSDGLSWVRSIFSVERC